MKKLCSIKTCESRIRLNAVTTFELPKNSKYIEKWKKFLSEHKIDYDSSKKYFLCAHHFNTDMIMVTNARLRLKFNAYPSKDVDRESVEQFLLSNSMSDSSLEIHPDDVLQRLDTSINNSTNDLNTISQDTSEKFLQNQITLLRIQLEDAVGSASKYKKLYEECKKELDSLKGNLAKYVNEDQIRSIMGYKVAKWSDSTVQKSIALKNLGGVKVLDFLRKFVVPVVAPKTLFEITRGLPFEPGVLKFNIDVLNLMTENFEEHNLSADIKIDEKSLVPGRAFDASNSCYVGEVTIPKSNVLATNVFAVLLTLLSVRIKILVGYHFTGSSFDADAVKDFLYEVIKQVESKSKVKVRAMTMDMGPSNCSLANSMGLSTKKYSRNYFVQHPCDSSRKLRLIFDSVHHLKNLASGLRLHDVKIDDKYVEEFNLSSKCARFSEIRSLFSKQSTMIYKPCPSLKKEVIKPTHFETMRESTATNLFNSDVSTALDFIKVNPMLDDMLSENSTENFEYKISATSWLLKFFNHYEKLMTKQIWTKENYQENTEWLNCAIPVFESLKFESSYKKCTTGAVLGILSVIDLIGDMLNQGVEQINVEYLTSNAIENFFSQIVHYASKPSAYNFIQAAKSLSLSCYMQDPINTRNYKFSHGNISTCSNFLQLLKSNDSKCSKETVEIEDNFHINLPNQISWEALFITKLEFNAFICAMTSLSERFVKSLKCDNCKARFFIYSKDLSLTNVLNRLRSDTVWDLSPEMVDFFLSLEFLYRCISQSISSSSPTFKREFINNAVAQSDFIIEHCEQTTHKLLSTFINFRLKMELHGRLMHKRNMFSSRCN